MEMGNFLHFKAVEFANATGAFHKATHYCSTSKHVIDYCLGVVRASMMADLCVCACVRLLRPLACLPLTPSPCCWPADFAPFPRSS